MKDSIATIVQPTILNPAFDPIYIYSNYNLFFSNPLEWILLEKIDLIQFLRTPEVWRVRIIRCFRKVSNSVLERPPIRSKGVGTKEVGASSKFSCICSVFEGKRISCEQCSSFFLFQPSVVDQKWTSSLVHESNIKWKILGKGENIWDHMTHTKPDLIVNRANGDIACDSYHKYEEDIKMMENLGVRTRYFQKTDRFLRTLVHIAVVRFRWISIDSPYRGRAYCQRVSRIKLIQKGFGITTI